ncbi:MAG: hypothetical protein HYX38_00995 [Rhodospirillales bacterium]|nr:hypothetical protein [Rhodospirillales bacterium]
MRCTIHPATAQDIANIVIGHAARTHDAEDDGHDYLDVLLEACAGSRQVWTASNAEGEPLALIGAAPWAQDRGRGRLWFVILAAYGGNDADLASVVRQSVMEMLQVFAQLENHVSTEKAWALGLMRDAGFTIEPAQASPDGIDRHRVWIDAGITNGAAPAA